MIILSIGIICVLFGFCSYLNFFTKLKKLPFIFNQFIYGSLLGIASISSIYLNVIESGWKSVNACDSIVILSTLVFGPLSGIFTSVYTLLFRLIAFLATHNIDTVNYVSLAAPIFTLLAAFCLYIIQKHKNTSLFFKIISLTSVVEFIHLILISVLGSMDLQTAINHIVNLFVPSFVYNIAVACLSLLFYDIIFKRSRGYGLKDYFTSNSMRKNVPIFSSFQFWIILIFVAAFSANIFILSEFYTYESYSNASARYTDDLATMKELIYADIKYNPQDSLKDTAAFYVDDWSLDSNFKYCLTDQDNNYVVGTQGHESIINSTSSHPELNLYYCIEDGENYFAMYVNLDEYKIVSFIPEKYEMFIPNIIICTITMSQVILFILIMVIIFILLNNVIVKRLQYVNDSLQKIIDGDLNKKVTEFSSREFAHLSNSINKTVSTLNKYIEMEANRLNSELDIARRIQQSSMPNTFPAFPHSPEIDLYSMYKPSKIVGGDFYDYFHIDKDKIAILIADVSGKSIPAAMFMMRAKSAIKSVINETSVPSEILFKVNNLLCEDNEACMFVTVWLGVLDVNLGYLDYSSAGHECPIIVNPSKNKVFELKSNVSLVLGAQSNSMYENSSYYFNPGEKLLLYTDGVTEAHDVNNNLLGFESLKNLLLKNKNNSVKNITKSIAKEVEKYSAGKEQFDDYCLVCFEYQKNNFVLKKNNNYWETEFTVISDLASVSRVVEQFENIFSYSNAPKSYIKLLNVCIDEIFSNIMKFGYTKRSDTVSIKIIIDETSTKNYVSITFVDGGVYFNPLKQDKPDTTLSAEEREFGGLGIYISRELVDEMKYQYKDSLNHLTLIKYY